MVEPRQVGSGVAAAAERAASATPADFSGKIPQRYGYSALCTTGTFSPSGRLSGDTPRCTRSIALAACRSHALNSALAVRELGFSALIRRKCNQERQIGQSSALIGAAASIQRFPQRLQRGDIHFFDIGEMRDFPLCWPAGD